LELCLKIKAVKKEYVLSSTEVIQRRMTWGNDHERQRYIKGGRRELFHCVISEFS
jgi:hypothetical protein